jgi:hypothetical protein
MLYEYALYIAYSYVALVIKKLFNKILFYFYRDFLFLFYLGLFIYIYIIYIYNPYFYYYFILLRKHVCLRNQGSILINILYLIAELRKEIS